MDKLSHIWHFICRHKYFLTVSVFACLILFVDEHNVMRRLQHQKELHQLRQEIEVYRTQYENDTRRLVELEENPDAIEHIAREKYLMKKPNEDIFVFDEDLK